MEAELEALEEAQKLLEEENKLLEEENADLNDEIKRLKNDVSIVNAELRLASDRFDTAARKLDEMKEIEKILRSECDEARRERDAFRSQSPSANSMEIARLMQEISILESDNEMLNMQLKQVVEQLRETDDNLKLKAELLTNSMDDTHNLKEAYNNTQNTIKMLSDENHSLKAKILNLESVNAAAEAKSRSIVNNEFSRFVAQTEQFTPIPGKPPPGSSALEMAGNLEMLPDSILMLELRAKEETIRRLSRKLEVFSMNYSTQSPDEWKKKEDQLREALRKAELQLEHRENSRVQAELNLKAEKNARQGAEETSYRLREAVKEGAHAAAEKARRLQTEKDNLVEIIGKSHDDLLAVQNWAFLEEKRGRRRLRRAERRLERLRRFVVEEIGEEGELLVKGLLEDEHKDKNLSSDEEETSELRHQSLMHRVESSQNKKQSSGNLRKEEKKTQESPVISVNIPPVDSVSFAITASSAPPPAINTIKMSSSREVNSANNLKGGSNMLHPFGQISAVDTSRELVANTTGLASKSIGSSPLSGSPPPADEDNHHPPLNTTPAISALASRNHTANNSNTNLIGPSNLHSKTGSKFDEEPEELAKSLTENTQRTRERTRLGSAEHDSIPSSMETGVNASNDSHVDAQDGRHNLHRLDRDIGLERDSNQLRNRAVLARSSLQEEENRNWLMDLESNLLVHDSHEFENFAARSLIGKQESNSGGLRISGGGRQRTNNSSLLLASNNASKINSQRREHSPSSSVNGHAIHQQQLVSHSGGDDFR